MKQKDKQSSEYVYVSEPQENQNGLKDTNNVGCVTHKCDCFPLQGARTGQGGHGQPHISWIFYHDDAVS